MSHKWAEGFTLAIALVESNIPFNLSIYFITIQAIMNPIGIIIGWTLKNKGHFI
jgi:hypothetical protein